MKRSHLALAVLSILLSGSLLLGLSNDLSAQPFGGHCGGGPGKGVFSSLTDTGHLDRLSMYFFQHVSRMPGALAPEMIGVLYFCIPVIYPEILRAGSLTFNDNLVIPRLFKRSREKASRASITQNTAQRGESADFDPAR